MNHIFDSAYEFCLDLMKRKNSDSKSLRVYIVNNSSIPKVINANAITLSREKLI